MQHIIFVLVFILTLPKINKKLPFCLFSFIILFLFMSLRYDFGNDYMGYLEGHRLINLGLRSHVGNSYLYKQLNLLVHNFNFMVILISLFYLVIIGNLIKKNIRKKDYWFSVLILLVNPYLFVIHLSAFRQTLAILFFIISIKFIIEKKLIKYLLTISIAIGMHSSAILLFPFYFLINDKKLNKKLIVSIIIAISLFIITPLFDIILFKTVHYFPKYQNYVDQNFHNSMRSTILSSVYFFLMIFNINKLDKKEIIYGKLYLIGTIISLMAIKISMITRVGMYFDIFMIIVIPKIFKKIINKTYRYSLFFLIITIFLLRYYSFFINPMWYKFVRYKTILKI